MHYEHLIDKSHLIQAKKETPEPKAKHQTPNAKTSTVFVIFVMINLTVFLFFHHNISPRKSRVFCWSHSKLDHQFGNIFENVFKSVVKFLENYTKSVHLSMMMGKSFLATHFAANWHIGTSRERKYLAFDYTAGSIKKYA